MLQVETMLYVFGRMRQGYRPCIAFTNEQLELNSIICFRSHVLVSLAVMNEHVMACLPFSLLSVPCSHLGEGCKGRVCHVLTWVPGSHLGECAMFCGVCYVLWRVCQVLTWVRVVCGNGPMRWWHWLH